MGFPDEEVLTSFGQSGVLRRVSSCGPLAGWGRGGSSPRGCGPHGGSDDAWGRLLGVAVAES